MLGEVDMANNQQSLGCEKIDCYIKEADKLKEKIAILLDLYTDGDISKEVFKEKKNKLDARIAELNALIEETRVSIRESDNEISSADRMKSLSEFIKMKAFGNRQKIPQTIIEYYVERIIYDKGVFTWYLSPKLGNKILEIDAKDMKKNSSKLLFHDNGSTGGYC